MSAKFDLYESDDGTFTFDLKAANGEVIASSQVYTSRRDAMNGIMAVREAAPIAELPPDHDHLLHMQ